jgi:hypothetical protein
MAKKPKHPGQSYSKAEHRLAALHHAAIGSVASSWAIFELLIDAKALELADIEVTAGLCFTAQISGSARKLDAYIAIARLRGAGSFAGELDAFAKDTTGLAERRNRIVHDPWQIFGAPFRTEITARRKLRAMQVSVSSADVRTCNIDILLHIGRFLARHAKIRTAIAASRGKPH